MNSEGPKPPYTYIYAVSQNSENPICEKIWNWMLACFN